MKRFAGVLFLALLAGGCPDNSPVGPSESVVTPSYAGYQLLGRVFCENGQPLDIATVTATESPADLFNRPPYVEDGPEGYFVILNVSGRVTLYVHAPGHESVTRTVEMMGSDQTITIKLKMLD